MELKNLLHCKQRVGILVQRLVRAFEVRLSLTNIILCVSEDQSLPRSYNPPDHCIKSTFWRISYGNTGFQCQMHATMLIDSSSRAKSRKASGYCSTLQIVEHRLLAIKETLKQDAPGCHALQELGHERTYEKR